eukprot:TRINITY_DN2354_c0_g1_i16.p1 TRINITY_DN2354_c0_g1~~TRINITY_DN2354_c0_g1_i16.p1  ORF type:complete len:151 (-),score=29.45 TRINITY_DN2354_c0_g1_i16:552-1004(-)
MGGTSSAPSPPPDHGQAADQAKPDLTKLTEDDFKAQVRDSAQRFKQMVQGNKVMIFSATYCTYCTVAKRTLDDIGTKYGVVEVNKAVDGEMMMNIVSAVTGSKTVPQIFICGEYIPGGGSGLRHLATSGQLETILKECCDGDITCSKYSV